MTATVTVSVVIVTSVVTSGIICAGPAHGTAVIPHIVARAIVYAAPAITAAVIARIMANAIIRTAAAELAAIIVGIVTSAIVGAGPAEVHGWRGGHAAKAATHDRTTATAAAMTVSLCHSRNYSYREDG
ncbi:MAG: hypothetical protein ACR2FX_00965 [Chthoniobacterales bacterium]